MRIYTVLISAFISLALVACGAAGKSGGDAPSAHTQLTTISADLQKKLDDAAAPITETDALINRFTELPKTLNLSADDYKDFVIYAIRGEIKLPEGASEEVTKELNGFAQELKAYNDRITATPDNVTALVEEIVASLGKVPVLVTQIEADAQVVKANPLASKQEKTDAAKRSSEAKGLGNDVTNKIKGIQTQAKDLPAKAAEALSKFTTALKNAGIDNLDTLKNTANNAAGDAVKDAKDAGNQVVDTAKESAQDSVEAAKSAAE